jgi:fatty acid synthase subunit alpha
LLQEEFRNLPTATNAIFHGPEVNIAVEDIISFSTIVGNDSDAYRSSGPNSEVPMDFGIKLGWKAIMKPLFPKSIAGDLLALVHLSNRFDMRDKAPKLKVIISIGLLR